MKNLNYFKLYFYFSGIRKYGRNFKAVAEVVGNKTEANVRSFFVNYRRRFNLDGVLQEYEAEHGISGDADEKVLKYFHVYYLLEDFEVF